MPLCRIDVPDSMAAADRARTGTIVYEAMRRTLGVPENDHFQVITGHPAADLVIDKTYLGIARSDAAVIIQVFLNEGRTVEKKQNFFKAVADDLHAAIGLRREDVFIHLVETKKENWSFGNGEAQYA